MSKQSSFWQAFFLGAGLGSAMLYFLGTKKGRQLLTEFLQTIDEYDLEEEIKKFIKNQQDNTSSVKNLIQHLSEKLPTDVKK
ncbi:MAG: hypothetical protein KatS3mg090_0174 [Patescibacteria group bacterium]|nr:MAG: hypothetical protein KatS3mg090_0174 [Patescibacteria group bacterium]